MRNNSHHSRLVRGSLFKTRMVFTQISGIIQEWFWKILGMTSMVSRLIALDVLQREIEDTFAIRHYQNNQCLNYLTEISYLPMLRVHLITEIAPEVPLNGSEEARNFQILNDLMVPCKMTNANHHRFHYSHLLVHLFPQICLHLCQCRHQ